MSAAAGVLEAQPAARTETAPEDEPVKQIMVAVHGIGDQFNFETVQLVVYQFCRYYGQPSALPLGRFHTLKVEQQGTYFLQSPPDPKLPANLGFAEIYWADIPRRIAKEGYNLEESRKWARTLVERIRLRAVADPNAREVQDYDMAAQILEEMIQTVDVLDRLLSLAGKFGIFEFNLKQLLTDFLGDVQLVGEFESQRQSLLAQFRKVMETVSRSYPDAEIFIISHSEGTVVSFLGLLEALSAPQVPAWAQQVYGYMTLGSPIDKHLTLWPELFEPYATPSPSWTSTDPADRIQWRNYYDYGDPVGFSLDAARRWLRVHGYDRIFEFEEQHDHGFERYLFPGKAHVDYWQDPEVFGHFIQEVVRPPDPRPPDRRPDYTAPPRNKPFQRVVSYVVPYMIPAVLMYLAAYILYKAVRASTDPTASESSLVILKNVAGLGALVGGLTVMTRIPRLTKSWLWRGVGVGVFALSMAGNVQLVTPEMQARVGAVFADALGLDPTTAVLGVTTVIGLAVAAIGRRFPTLGLKPLMVLGGLAITGIVVNNVFGATRRGVQGPLWQVFPAGLAYLYLWWLAALIFDLVFTWHRYIRQPVMQNYLDKVLPDAGSGVDAPAAAAVLTSLRDVATRATVTARGPG
jgi:hypothetical protein